MGLMTKFNHVFDFLRMSDHATVRLILEPKPNGLTEG
ncbi:hypothetical protein RKD49_007114 [Streptomyces glaucescens]